MKKIVICIDGTWNKPIDPRHDPAVHKSANTNVYKLKELLVSDASQKVFYLAGVGTSDSKIRNLFEGYTGTGTTKLIKEAYIYLIHTYNPGDEIYLFGFSRGAFAVRSLAGLIRKCGILDPEKNIAKLMLDRVDLAYDFYRDTSKDSKPSAPRSVEFRKANALDEETSVTFIGVWDTVGSLGNPAIPFSLSSKNSKFHDTTLSSTVKYAYQAIAICERRWLFTPSLWERSRDDNKKIINPAQVLEQRWFIGAHADIGGGYIEDGLSNMTLKWMIEKVQATSLRFKATPNLDFSKLLVHDETLNNPFYKINIGDRAIAELEKDGDSDSKLSRSEEIDRNVTSILADNIKVYWLNKEYRPKALFSYFNLRKTIYSLATFQK